MPSSRSGGNLIKQLESKGIDVKSGTKMGWLAKRILSLAEKKETDHDYLVASMRALGGPEPPHKKSVPKPH
jgi:hypothetical protein